MSLQTIWDALTGGGDTSTPATTQPAAQPAPPPYSTVGINLGGATQALPVLSFDQYAAQHRFDGFHQSLLSGLTGLSKDAAAEGYARYLASLQPLSTANLTSGLLRDALGGGDSTAAAATPAATPAPTPAPATQPSPTRAPTIPGVPPMAAAFAAGAPPSVLATLGAGNVDPAPAAAPAAPSGPAPAGGIFGDLGLSRRDVAAAAASKLLGMENIVADRLKATDAQRALRAAGIDPNSTQGRQMLASAALNTTGVKPFLGGERPGVPLLRYNPQTQGYDIAMSLPQPIPGATVQMGPNGQPVFQRVPGADVNMATNAGIEQGARVGAENALKNADYVRQFGTQPPGGGGPRLGAAPPPLPAAPGSMPAPPAAAMPTGGGATRSASRLPGTQTPGGDFVTEQGTVIPTPSAQVIGPGGEQTGLQLKNSADTEKNWNAVRPTIETARQRLGALADAFQTVETKGYTTAKAELSNKLRGLGLTGLADQVMSAKDTGAVQSALWNGMQDVLAQLKTINAGTGGRILNSEFNAFLDHGFSPDMLGAPLREAVTAQLGQTYQVGHMIDDYQKARRLGWRDANQFQSAYLQQNPVENFVAYADKTVPQFKGMGGGAGGPLKPLDTATKRAAENAILKGADKAAVYQRLKDKGYDTSGLK